MFAGGDIRSDVRMGSIGATAVETRGFDGGSETSLIRKRKDKS